MLGLASVKEQLESEVTAMATRMRTCAIGCATRIGTFASVGEMTEALDKVAFLEAQNASLSERLAQQVRLPVQQCGHMFLGIVCVR